LREEDKGAVSARTLPAYMRRRRLDAWDDGRWERMRRLRERVVVVLGEGILRGRSGIEAVKRITRYRICSGRGLAMLM